MKTERMIFMDNTMTKVLLHSSAYYLPFALPIIIFFISPDDEVKRLAVQAVLFQIIMGILLTISGIFSFVLVGIPFLIVFGLMYVITPIIGIVRALQNEPWRYPIVGSFI